MREIVLTTSGDCYEDLNKTINMKVVGLTGKGHIFISTLLRLLFFSAKIPNM